MNRPNLETFLRAARVHLRLHAQLDGARYLARWAVLVAPLAVVTGSAVALFLWLLEKATDARFDQPGLLYLLPLAGLVVSVIYRRFGAHAERGNNLIFEEIRTPGAGVPARMAPLVFAGTVITHLFGGSAGREGTALQMGGGIAGGMGRWLRLNPAQLRVFLMAGVAAGFGAVFGTPFAGAIFATEVLVAGRLEYAALLPALIAAVIADWTTAAWGIEHTNYEVATIAVTPDGLPFSLLLMAKVVLASAAFGFASVLFAESVHAVGRFTQATIRRPEFRPVVGGVAVIALVLATGTRDYLGLGLSSPVAGATTIVSSFHDGGASPFAWLAKTVFTAVTLGSGFKGGEVTPLFYVGASLGNTLAGVLHAPVDLFASLGFVAVFAGAANAPVASTVMGIELFGAGNSVYLAVACFVSYLVSGHGGIYVAQRIAATKAAKPGPPGHSSESHTPQSQQSGDSDR